eukprot:tig00020554_g10862.t1
MFGGLSQLGKKLAANVQEVAKQAANGAAVVQQKAQEAAQTAALKAKEKAEQVKDIKIFKSTSAVQDDGIDAPEEPPPPTGLAKLKMEVQGSFKKLSDKALGDVEGDTTGGKMKNLMQNVAVKVKSKIEVGVQKAKEEFLSGSSDSTGLIPGQPPWVPTTELEVGYENVLRHRILELSKDRNTFTTGPPDDDSFPFELEAYLPTALAALKVDATLDRMRFLLVPRKIQEPRFWRNYFFHVLRMKQELMEIKLGRRLDPGLFDLSKSFLPPAPAPASPVPPSPASAAPVTPSAPAARLPTPAPASAPAPGLAKPAASTPAPAAAAKPAGAAAPAAAAPAKPAEDLNIDDEFEKFLEEGGDGLPEGGDGADLLKDEEELFS